MREQDDNERPPFFGSWRNIYVLVISVETAIILLLYFFTVHFE